MSQSILTKQYDFVRDDAVQQPPNGSERRPNHATSSSSRQSAAGNGHGPRSRSRSPTTTAPQSRSRSPVQHSYGNDSSSFTIPRNTSISTRVGMQRFVASASDEDDNLSLGSRASSVASTGSWRDRVKSRKSAAVNLNGSAPPPSVQPPTEPQQAVKSVAEAAGPDVSLPPAISNAIPSNTVAASTDATPAATKPHPQREGTITVGSEEINKLSAQAMKAKLRRDMKTHDALQAQIAAIKARAAVEKAHAPADSQQQTVVILDALDTCAIPLTLRHAAAERQKQLAKGGASKFNGAAHASLDTAVDEDHMSMTDLAREERLGAAAALDKQYAKSIMHNDNYKFSGDTDDAFDTADTMTKRLAAKQHNKALTFDPRAAAIASTNKFNDQIERCTMCTTSPAYKQAKHLTASSGLRWYLAVARTNWITDLHATLQPMEHIKHSLELDQVGADELQYWQRTLHHVYQQHKPPLIPIFAETYLAGATHHSRIDCIPIPSDQVNDARMYFRQAVSGLQTDTHHSSLSSANQHRQLIDLQQQHKTLSQVLPTNTDVSFVHVQFGGLDRYDGYVHVVENSHTFDRAFALSVMCGVLEQEADLLLRNKPAGSKQLEYQRVNALKSFWRPHDWTKQLSAS